MIEQLACELVSDAGATIGEGPLWDDLRQEWLWVDVPSMSVHTLLPSAYGAWRAGRKWNIGAPACFAIPRRAGGILVGAGNRIVVLQEDGAVSPVCEVPVAAPEDRINDGKCDAMGRLWLGTLSMSAQPTAALYRLDADGRLHKMLHGLRLANGLDWSPDGRRFYFIDSLDFAIDSFEFDMAKGTLGRRERLISLEAGAGIPDGMCVDETGHLWLALFMGGEVRRYSPLGECVARIPIMAPQVTSCAFGGEKREDLLITTGKTPLPEWLLSAAGLPAGSDSHAVNSPGAGGIFLCRPGVRGPVATYFAG